MENGQVGLSHQGGSQGMRERAFTRFGEIGWIKNIRRIGMWSESGKDMGDLL